MKFIVLLALLVLSSISEAQTATPAPTTTPTRAGYQVNPNGLDAKSYGHVKISGLLSGQACRNQPILTTDPDASRRKTGDQWCVDTATRHHMCIQGAGSVFCAAASVYLTPTPSPTP